MRDERVLRARDAAFESIKYIAGICSRPLTQRAFILSARAPAHTQTNVFPQRVSSEAVYDE